MKLFASGISLEKSSNVSVSGEFITVLITHTHCTARLWLLYEVATPTTIQVWRLEVSQAFTHLNSLRCFRISWSQKNSNIQQAFALLLVILHTSHDFSSISATITINHFTLDSLLGMLCRLRAALLFLQANNIQKNENDKNKVNYN